MDSDEADSWVVARIATDGNQNWEYCGLIIVDDATLTKWARITIGAAAANASFQVDSTTVASTAGLGAAIGTGIWMLLKRRGDYIQAYYSTANQAAPPTSWTYLGGRQWPGTVDNLPAKFRIGYLMGNALNPGAGYNMDVLYFDHSLWREIGRVELRHVLGVEQGIKLALQP